MSIWLDMSDNGVILPHNRIPGVLGEFRLHFSSFPEEKGHVV